MSKTPKFKKFDICAMPYQYFELQPVEKVLGPRAVYGPTKD